MRPSQLALGLLFAGSFLLPATGSAQGDPMWRAFRAARSLALGGQVAAAKLAFAASATEARSQGEKAVLTASLRAAADLFSLDRPCTDVPERTLREAVAAADVGDRTAADALVRLLASRGNTAGARTVLLDAYGNVPALGRAITRESLHYLQGQAAIESAEGHESAALSALNQALAIAARLRAGDVSDTVARPSGSVDAENAWVLFDLAQLRLHARSADIRVPKSGMSIMSLLASAAPRLLEGGDEAPYPLTRLADRLAILAHARSSITRPPAC